MEVNEHAFLCTGIEEKKTRSSGGQKASKEEESKAESNTSSLVVLSRSTFTVAFVDLKYWQD